MKELINYEDPVVKDILEKGMEKSARSLGVMINCEIGVKDMQIKQADEYAIDMIFGKEGKEDDVLILKTELVGPVGGINYMFLSKSDVQAIKQSTFTDEISEEDSTQLTIEFLKEIENVLAAATITEIANRFQIDMFGDVPKIQAVLSTEVDNVVKAEVSALLPKLQLKCNFSIDNIGISPDVIWMFNDAFIQRAGSISSPTVDLCE